MNQDRKSRKSTSVVSEGAAQAVLRRGRTRELAPDEERVMRSRLGATVPATSTLDWMDDELSEDQQVELQAMQIEAWMKWKAHLAARRAPAPASVAVARPATNRPAVSPQPSRAKEKIVRALRKQR
jgi:hypothetical protein